MGNKTITLVNGYREVGEVEHICAFEVPELNGKYIIYTKNEQDKDGNTIIYAGKITSKDNKQFLENSGLKYDSLGHIYTVINRDPNIKLGSEDDRVLLMKELNDIQNILVKLNIIDLLAYELVPLEDSEIGKDGSEIFENSYLIKFTPADDVSKQYVKPWSCFLIFFVIPVLIASGVFSLVYFI